MHWELPILAWRDTELKPQQEETSWMGAVVQVKGEELQ
jgi:hypothetical protein